MKIYANRTFARLTALLHAGQGQQRRGQLHADKTANLRGLKVRLRLNLFALLLQVRVRLGGNAQQLLRVCGTILGGVFGGSIMTEIIFGYPGVGTLIQNAILQSDYNMILGCITISIVAISTATLVVDLIYPFIDPRIRYG